MATKRNDLLGRLADLSEEAIQRLSDVPGADRALTTINTLRDRTDELQRRVRGLEGLESRIVELERKVEKLQKGASSTARSTAKKTTTTKSSSAQKSG
jgi:cell division septum initiation protein DivIVA